ncbi:MAG: 2-nitropropane dioxygenase, partial [bacterium]|nr:2-nitropropane dioxygenase [bacterium]
RALNNKGTDEFNRLQFKILKQIDSGEIDRLTAQGLVEEFWIGGLHKAVIDGDVVNGSLMAGQAVGLAAEIKPVKDLIEELVGDAGQELSRMAALLSDQTR